jgi:DNA invertase Pin-like site-specific DNA recombinase
MREDFHRAIIGAVTDRPALREALAFARSGYALIVWKLDRLARSMKQLIETIEELRLKGIDSRSRPKSSTRRPRRIGLFFTCLARWRNLSAA